MDKPFEYTKYPENEPSYLEIWEQYSRPAKKLNEALGYNFRQPINEHQDLDNDDVVLFRITKEKFEAVIHILVSEDVLQINESANRRTKPDILSEIRKAEQLLEFAILAKKMWQKTTIYVFFIGGTPIDIAKVMKFSSEWSDYCGITFKQTFDQNSSDIRVSFVNSGHWSYIGTIALDRPKNEATVNFEISGIPDDTEFRRIILHEFGHVLGLIHEHQSPKAKLTWDKDFIYRALFARYGWDRYKVDVNLFDTYDKELKMYGPLDTSSIMAYEIPANFTKEKIVFPVNYDISPTDQLYIGRLYPKPATLLL